MSDPTTARENIKLNSLVHRSCPPPANNHHKRRLPNRFSASFDRKGMTLRRYRIPCQQTGLSHYMSVSEARQLERRLHTFTFTWASVIIKIRVGSIVKIFLIRYALTFQSVCCWKVISFVQTAAPSFLRSPFSLR